MLYLTRNLTKVIDEANDGILSERIIDAVNINIAFIEQMVEHIDFFHSNRPLLLVAEYQVDPLVQMGTHIVTF